MSEGVVHQGVNSPTGPTPTGVQLPVWLFRGQFPFATVDGGNQYDPAADNLAWAREHYDVLDDFKDSDHPAAPLAQRVVKYLDAVGETEAGEGS